MKLLWVVNILFMLFDVACSIKIPGRSLGLLPPALGKSKFLSVATSAELCNDCSKEVDKKVDLLTIRGGSLPIVTKTSLNSIKLVLQVLQSVVILLMICSLGVSHIFQCIMLDGATT